MNKLYLLLLVFSLALTSCSKQRKSTWMYYDETSCADKWAFHNTNEILKDNAMKYLESKKITVYEMEIFRFTEPETCSACTCKTGRRYKAKVKNGDVKEAKREGFLIW